MILWQSASDYAAWASVFIGLIALFRPEIVAAVQRKKAFVDFHPRPSKTMLIGFNGCPRCWLDGTLESVSSDTLVTSAELMITRQRDKSTHNFQWVLWESTMINDERASPAYAFRLYQSNPISGLYSFEDSETAQLYAGEMGELRQAFETYILQKFPSQAQFPDDEHQEFKEFSNSPTGNNTVGNALKKIQKAIYWEAGQYKAELIFQTKRPDKKHRFRFHFKLNQQEQDLLEANAVKTLWQSAGLKNIRFHQVSVEILEFQKIENLD
jgi:hypothetical protein